MEQYFKKLLLRTSNNLLEKIIIFIVWGVYNIFNPGKLHKYLNEFLETITETFDEWEARFSNKFHILSPINKKFLIKRILNEKLMVSNLFKPSQVLNNLIDYEVLQDVTGTLYKEEEEILKIEIQNRINEFKQLYPKASMVSIRNLLYVPTECNKNQFNECIKNKEGYVIVNSLNYPQWIVVPVESIDTAMYSILSNAKDIERCEVRAI